MENEIELELEFERQCIEDGESLSDTLTMLVTMIGVNTVHDVDPDIEP